MPGVMHHYIVEVEDELAGDISLMCDRDFPSGSRELKGYSPRQVLSYILLKEECISALDMAWRNYEAGRGIRIIDCEDADAASLPPCLWGMHPDVVKQAHVSDVRVGSEDVGVYKLPSNTRRDCKNQLVLNL